MILCDSSFNLLGISKNLLSLLEYESFDDFFLKNSNINEFLIDNNYEQTTENDYFIRNIINKNNVFLTIKTGKNRNIEVEVFIDKFNFNNNQSIAYEINLVKIDESSFCKFTKQEANLSLNAQLGIDEKWLTDGAKYLGIHIDDFEFFIKELIKSAQEKESILYEALVSGNKNLSYAIISFLKDPAKTLNIKPIISALDALENTENSLIEENFANFQYTLNTINKFLQKRKES